MWIQKSRIIEVLGDYVENPLQGIEAVNAKYPNGWYCEAFEEVREDIKKIKPNADTSLHFIGWNKEDGHNNTHKDYLHIYQKGSTLITQSEYISITRGSEPTKRNLDINCTIKRNWSNCHEGAILDKPIIFSSLPNDLTSRIERIEKHLNLS